MESPPPSPAYSQEQPPATPLRLALPPARPLVTYVIIAVCVLLYLLQIASQSVYGFDIVAALGAKVNPLIVQGQLWRLFTPMFLHVSILHIGFNMYALYNFGPSLERHYGHGRFLALYVLGGSELCARALEADIEPEYARGLVRRWKLPPPAGARTLEAWPWELKLRTLGGFALEMSGETPHFEGKAQRAPLALLKALIAFGGEGGPETKLMDALWPDSEGAAAQQALATTLFRLRKLVGEGVVARGGGRLTLDPEHWWVDALALQRLLADAAIRDDELGPRLLALYPGPFLAGEEDCPWALPLREKRTRG